MGPRQLAAASIDAVEGEAILLGANERNGKVRPGQHMLPPLPYAYDALEPYISERTMRLHHDVHHREYVDELNRAEVALARARRNRDWTALTHCERKLAFNGSGHFLHSIFWTIMSPNGGGRPIDEVFARQLERDFGSFDGFRAHFTEAANEVEGGGWALLVWQPIGEKLEILQTEQHQHFTQWTTIPILVIDVWEHAYYLQYQTRRPDYIESWWNVVNWPNVARRWREARRTGVSGGVANGPGAPDKVAPDEAAPDKSTPDEGDRSDDAGTGRSNDSPDGAVPDTPHGDKSRTEDAPQREDDSPAGDERPSGDEHAPPSPDHQDERKGGGRDAEPSNGDEDRGAYNGKGRPFNDVDYNDSHMEDDTADVKTLYGTRATIRRAMRGGTVRSGTPTRTGTLRYVYGRRSSPNS